MLGWEDGPLGRKAVAVSSGILVGPDRRLESQTTGRDSLVQGSGHRNERDPAVNEDEAVGLYH